MRIVEELSSFYRHIYLNLPGVTRLVDVAGAGAPLRFGVFPANLYKTADLISLRVNCSYWTILCFTLLDNRRYQRERRSVTRCNERLVVCIFVFERLGEGTGDVFAGDLTPPTDLLGRLYGARSLILGQAAGTYYGVVETTALQTFVGAGLGAEIRTHCLRAPFRFVRAHRAEHQVAAHPTILRGLDQLGGPPVVHGLLALGPAPRSGASGEDDGLAPLDRTPDPPSDLLGFQIDHHRLGAVGLDIARLLLLADEPPDLVAFFGQHPYQTPRRLAMRASDQNPHENYLLGTITTLQVSTRQPSASAFSTSASRPIASPRASNFPWRCFVVRGRPRPAREK